MREAGDSFKRQCTIPSTEHPSFLRIIWRYGQGVTNVSKFVVLDVTRDEAKVRHLGGPDEWWPLANLPSGLQVGDLVRLTEHAGDVQIEIEWIGSPHPA